MKIAKIEKIFILVDLLHTYGSHFSISMDHIAQTWNSHAKYFHTQNTCAKECNCPFAPTTFALLDLSHNEENLIQIV
jgi:hypothetical protein